MEVSDISQEGEEKDVITISVPSDMFTGKVLDNLKKIVAGKQTLLNHRNSNRSRCKSLLSNFSGYVISRNVPQCKKFIRDFVKEVIVYKEHI